MDEMNTRELMSALTDGQLDSEALARGIALAMSDPSARTAWHDYHLIGDVLRSAELAGGTAPAAFMGRMQLRLRQEHAVPVPAGGAALAPYQRQLSAPADLSARVRAEAANDGSFRWKLVAGVASAAAVAAVAWTLIAGLAPKPDQGQFAVAPAPTKPVATLANGERGVMIRDARLDELLAAHRQLGGASVLQTPTGFVRNATFEGPAR